jgi:hypothetical protein
MMGDDVKKDVKKKVKTLVLAVGLAVVVVGCQSMPQSPTTTLDNESFMSLWGRYARCQAGTDLLAMQSEAQHLQHIAATTTENTGFSLNLPKPIKRYVAEPPTRLAVDPKAMAAACTLSTGQIAAELGKTDVAAAMFQTVLKNHAQAEYEYYAAQARAGLAQLELAMKDEGRARVVRTGR